MAIVNVNKYKYSLEWSDEDQTFIYKLDTLNDTNIIYAF